MTKRRITVSISLVLVFSGVLLIYQQLNDEHSQKLEIRLLNKISGDAAVKFVKSIHAGDFYVEDAEIREYSGGIKVWIAYVNSSETAKSYVERMAKKVDAYFSKPETVKFNNLSAYRVYGSGKTHYFFALENSVVWVEFANLDFEFHKKALKEIFGS